MKKKVIVGEADLWRNYVAGGKDVALRNELAGHYYYLVGDTAERVIRTLPRCVQEGDLCSYGGEGLLDAVERFDPERHIRFPTYAKKRIWGAMIDGLRREDYVPQSVRRDFKEKENGQRPFIPKLLYLGDPYRRYSDGSVLSLGMSLADASAGDPAMIAEQEDAVCWLLALLSPRDREFIIKNVLRGIDGAAIARERGVTASLACHVRKKSLQRIRERGERYAAL